MSAYLFTFTFILMITFLTSSEMTQFVQGQVELRCYQTWQKKLVDEANIRERTHLEELSLKQKEKESVTNEGKGDQIDFDTPSSRNTDSSQISLGFNLQRPPNNSRINFFVLLHCQPHPYEPKEYSLYETTARLIRSIYCKEPLFQEIVNAEYRLLDALLSVKEQTIHFYTPDALSSVCLDDELLQTLFYRMFKGTKQAPSLLNYITFDDAALLSIHQKKINVMFADRAILEALFEEPLVAKKIIDLRTHLLEEMIYQEEYRLEKTIDGYKNRTDFKSELTKEVEKILSENGLAVQKYKRAVLDFTLGSPGSILFIKDPLTEQFVRKKYKDGRYIMRLEKNKTDS